MELQSSVVHSVQDHPAIVDEYKLLSVVQPPEFAHAPVTDCVVHPEEVSSDV
jgi:hypothetical protein